MNKLLLFILIFFCAGAQAQSISISELTDLAQLNNQQVSAYFNTGKKFYLMSSEQIRGFTMDTYRAGNDKENEVITTGLGVRLGKTILHTVNYYATKPKLVYALKKQVEQMGYRLNFSGADSQRKIFLYDNELYRISIYIYRNNTAANIEIRERMPGIE